MPTLLLRRSALIAILAAFFAVAGAAGARAATTSWTTLPAPWYAPSMQGYTDDAPAYRLHTMSSVTVVGHYAYTVESTLDRITVLDVADPANPTVVGSLRDPAHMDIPTWIVVQNGLAYVTSKGNGNTDLAGSSLSIYDVSNPAAPAFVGSVGGDSRLYGAYSVAVSGTHAFIAAQGCVGVSTCYTSYPGGNALTTVDVSDPAHPAIAGSVSSLPATQHLDSIVVVGNRAYGTAYYTGRLTAFDISDPANPAIISTRWHSWLLYANDVEVNGPYAYVVDQTTSGARLTTVDVTNPANMKVVGSVLDDTNLEYAYRLRVNSDFAFVAAPLANAMTVVDIRQPAAPQVVASISDPVKIANPIGLDVVGDEAYVASYCPKISGKCDPTQHGGLSTIDVSAFGDGAPDTAITSGPPATTTSTSADFTFTSTRTGSTFACALDGAAAAPCTSPQDYSGLAGGSHTLTVTATSLAGVPDPTPATYTWTVSTGAPPTASITSAPSPTTTSTSRSATIAFTADDPAATFECRLDGAAWQACTSPDDLTGLADGSHSFDVRASNAAGTGGAATATWTVDATPPTVAVTAPAAVNGTVGLAFSEPVTGVTTANTTLAVAGSGTTVAATVSCKDAGAHAVSCASGPVTTATLKPSALLTAGETYRVTADPSGPAPIADRAGNALATTSSTFRAQVWVQENSPAVAQDWGTVADPQALGGSYATEQLAGASVAYTFSGTSVTWDTITGPGQGTASVAVDGVAKGSFDQSGATTTYGVGRTFSGLANKQHTLTITVGSTGAVAVDGFAVGATQDPSPALTGRWQTVSNAAANAGSYIQSAQAGARTSLTFHGTSVALFTTKGPQGGKATVGIDGATVATIDTYASSPAYKVKRSFTVPDGVHTVVVTVLGTAQAASTGTLVGVDGFSIG
jgi:hypothetical protein